MTDKYVAEAVASHMDLQSKHAPRRIGTSAVVAACKASDGENSARSVPTIVTGCDVARWPEFRGLVNRLGVDMDHVAKITISLPNDGLVRVFVTRLGLDSKEGDSGD